MIKLEKKRIQKIKDYHYFSIPKALVDNKVLDITKEYDVTIEEVIIDG